MKKINVAELLKDCPSGMELDCTIWNSDVKVFLKEVRNDDFTYPIVVTIKDNNIEYSHSFTKYGAYNDYPYCKCVLFPKGKTTWEGFIPPCQFKDENIIIQDDNKITFDGREFILKLSDIQLQQNNTTILHLPEGHEFVDEKGNVINTDKIILIKKQPQYPNTYEECCEILEVESEFTINDLTVNEKDFLKSIIKLKECREAYWIIAGFWQPDFTNKEQKKFTISFIEDEIYFSDTYVRNSFLVFPTAEMRDAFYENFKDLIEECKELL